MLDEHDQLAVIQGLRDGNRQAWERLYDAYSADVWRYVARLLGPRPAAVADVVQEVFLAAAVAARQFDADRGPLWGWLAGIAHHKVVAHWRQAARADRVRAMAQAGLLEIREWLEAPAPDDPLRVAGAAREAIRVDRAGPVGGASLDGAPDSAGLAHADRAAGNPAIESRTGVDLTAAAMAAADLADVVRAALAELPADYAALLVAKYLDDRTLVDMARQSGVTVDAIKSKLARARRDFRTRFEQLSGAPTRSTPP